MWDDDMSPEKMKAKLHEWNREMADVGFAGSEYYNEPKAVALRIRELKDLLVRVSLERNRLRQQR